MNIFEKLFKFISNCTYIKLYLYQIVHLLNNYILYYYYLLYCI